MLGDFKQSVILNMLEKMLQVMAIYIFNRSKKIKVCLPFWPENLEGQ